MRRPLPILPIFPALLAVAVAVRAPAAEMSVTVYNQRFAVVREHLALDLKPGENRVRFADTTAHVETDSVILRDPAGKVAFTVLEQDYRADPIAQGLLLMMNEGKTIDFLVMRDGKETVVKGTVVRSGYYPPPPRRNQQQWYQYQNEMAQSQPIVQIDGALRFGLPGTPLFPPLPDGTVLKPTLEWVIGAKEAVKVDAEVGYVTGGMGWEAAYNVISDNAGESLLDLSGWVTIDNETGKDFESVRLKLVAGDVSKLHQDEEQNERYLDAAKSAMASDGIDLGVTSKAFSDYHLYTLPRVGSFHDRESKQEAFLAAKGVKATKRLVYDGLMVDPRRYNGWNSENIRNQREFGTESNPKVWVMREFKNSEENHLGMPLPAGKVRFYLRDDDGHLEFTGENTIDHTPKDETLRIYTGNAFDVVGERRQTDYRLNNGRNDQLDESFTVTVRNHRAEPVEVTIVEHLYRWVNCEVQGNSHPFTKKDSRTIEFPVTIPANGEQVVTYTAHYWW